MGVLQYNLMTFNFTFYHLWKMSQTMTNVLGENVQDIFCFFTHFFTVQFNQIVLKTHFSCFNNHFKQIMMQKHISWF